jgi:hypothetical protein
MSRGGSGLAVLSLAAAWLSAGCRPSPNPASDEPPTGAAAMQPDSAAVARSATLEPGMLATVAADSVRGWTGAGQRTFEVARRSAIREGGHARQFGTITRSIALRDRSAEVTQYPCTSCHAGRRLVLAARRVPDAHHDIQPVHPDRTGAVCSTCHAEEDVALLALTGGGRAPLDESYRLCGECHFPEAGAWAGGGHGKRLDGWQGRRIVMACPDCHDPHQPAIQPRIPFRAPVLARTRRNGP